MPDVTPPLLSSVTIASDNAFGASYARAGSVVSLSIQANEPIVAPSATIAGSAATVTGGPLNWTASVTLAGTEPEGPISFTLAPIEDLAALDGPGATATTDSSSVVADFTPPISLLEVTDSTQVGGPITGSITQSDATSGIGATALWAKEQGGSWAQVGVTAASSWNHAPAGGGKFRFQSVARDNAGNYESAPAGSDAGDVVVWFNPVANAPLTITAEASGTGGALYFPMEANLDVRVEFATIAATGDLTVARSEGDIAPAGLPPAALIDQFVSISKAPSLDFDLATLRVGYDEALLGGLTEPQIQSAYRDNAGVVTPVPATVNIGLNQIEFSTTNFSDWYFGLMNAGLEDWGRFD